MYRPVCSHTRTHACRGQRLACSSQGFSLPLHVLVMQVPWWGLLSTEPSYQPTLLSLMQHTTIELQTSLRLNYPASVSLSEETNSPLLGRTGFLFVLLVVVVFLWGGEGGRFGSCLFILNLWALGPSERPCLKRSEGLLKSLTHPLLPLLREQPDCQPLGSCSFYPGS